METITSKLGIERDDPVSVGKYSFLFKHYLEICDILLVQSQKLPNIDYFDPEATPELIEEQEISQRGVGIYKYREFVTEIVSRTHQLLQRFLGESGETEIYRLILKKFE